MLYSDEYYYIGKQEQSIKQYLLLRLSGDSESIIAMSKSELTKSILADPLKFKNICVRDANLYSSIQNEYVELGLQDSIELQRTNTLCDYLLMLIRDNASFALLNSDYFLKFTDLSFSMKTDEISITEQLPNNEKRLHIIWTTPQLADIVSCGALRVWCSKSLYEAAFSSFTKLSETDSTVLFIFNPETVNCIWDLEYCLTRFSRHELQVLLYTYNILHAKVIGFDIGHWLNEQVKGRECNLYSHIGGKSGLAGTSIAFRVVANCPSAEQIRSLIQDNLSDVIDLMAQTPEQLENWLLNHLAGALKNDCLLEIAKNMIMAYHQEVHNDYVEKLHSLIAYYSCRIFEYKLAYSNPIVECPEIVDFNVGILHIDRGGIEHVE